MITVLAIFAVALTPRIFASERDVIAASNAFTTKLYNEIAKKTEDNFLFSPFSAESVLAFVQAGARGLTAKELRDVLSLPDDQDRIEAGFRRIHDRLQQQQGYVFNTANRLYVNDNFDIKVNFVETASSAFDAGLSVLDFGQGVRAARTMNEWVEDKTRGKIRDLITPDKVTTRTRAILINALYFKGNWTTPFRRQITHDTDFHVLNRRIKRVKSMTMNEDSKTFNFVENVTIGAQYLELPFQGSDASMVIVLPLNKLGIRHLEKHVDLVFKPQEFTREYVNMTIPKFKLETSVDVKEILKTLGAARAFTPGVADFSGITDDGLFISDVIQKTYIDVNEGGVEAAAATYSGLTLLSIQSTPQPKQFFANHPFIYYIKVKGLIVFAGRVMEPWY